ncbi:hypothetical protein D3C76_1743950 [compost metagenome]
MIEAQGTSTISSARIRPMKCEMKFAEALSAIRQLPASTTADSTTRTRTLGVQLPAKVWIEVTMDSTAP